MRVKMKFVWIAAMIVVGAAMIVAGALLRRDAPPGDYGEALAAAEDLLDGWAGCEVQIPEVVVIGADGEPCGDPWRPAGEGGHSATAYRCDSGGGSRWEVHINSPGDLHTQLCIVVHELGHVLGLSDGGRGIMNQHECPEFIRLTDQEVALVREWCFE